MTKSSTSRALPESTIKWGGKDTKRDIPLNSQIRLKMKL